MKPGTKAKITDGSGILDRLVGRVGTIVALSIGGDQTLINIPGEGSWWIYNCRLEEIKDEQEDDNKTRN